MPTQKQFLDAVKRSENKHPWNLLPKKAAFNDASHRYDLRTNQIQATVQLYGPILEAVALYSVQDYTHNDIPFRMVQSTTSNAVETIVEAGMCDGTSLLIVSSEGKVRMSVVETDLSHNPCLSFRNMDGVALRFILLSLMPQILSIDTKLGLKKIGNAVESLGKELEASNFGGDWKDARDIPSSAESAAYFLDAIYTAILTDSIALDFGAPSAIAPEEIGPEYFANPSVKLSGRLLCEDATKDWKPKLVTKDSGNTQSSHKIIRTLGDAKKLYAGFGTHLRWTEEEKKLIPNEFTDDMPVMRETLRFLRRITNTYNDSNPVVNLTWRAETGFGKTTGTRQLAYILNRPYLTMTGSPRMDEEKFRSDTLPRTEDTDEKKPPVSPAPSGPYAEYISMALDHVEGNIRSEAFTKMIENPSAMFQTIFSAPEEAEMQLFGRPVGLSSEKLCSAYTELTVYVRTAQMQQELQKAKSGESNAPRFLHVKSPYIIAMTRGYVFELQEPSRIKEPGTLVSLNGFDRPGRIMRLANGESVVRHKDALCICTDNIGYVSCRAMDQSYIRRQSMIIDSTLEHMSKERIFERLSLNTRVTNNDTLEFAYTIWDTIRAYCRHNSITSGSVSLCELEAFVQALRDEGTEYIKEIIFDCIISSASADPDEQNEIWMTVRDLTGAI